MKNVTKIIWLISIVSVSLSMLYYLIGSTAFFQRNIDLIRTVVLFAVGGPVFVFIILSVLALKKDWFPTQFVGKISLLIIIIIFSLISVTTLLRYTNPHGWIKENVLKDYTQTTIDNKYEYRLELVNLFQKNSFARIYIKDISNDYETKISLDIPVCEKDVIIGGEGYTNSDLNIYGVWSELTPSDTKGIYVLTTTELFDSENSYCFQINIEDKTAIRK